MSHSSPDKHLRNDFLTAELDALQKKVDGTFPDGKLTDDDEGALAFAVGLVNNKVVIDFAKPVKSFGLTPDQAIELAKLLMKRAAFAKGEPI